MRISRTAEAPPEPLDSDHFTGPATRRDLGRIETPDGSALVVSFDPGTRNRWHRHSGGQILYVIEGAGRVAVRGGDEVRIGPGDLVYAPPGEDHWHGAAEDEPMVHLALSFGETEWLDGA